MPSQIVALVVAYVADKRKHRAGFIVLTAVITIAGISLLAFASQNSVRYLGMSVFGSRIADIDKLIRCIPDKCGERWLHTNGFCICNSSPQQQCLFDSYVSLGCQ